MEHLVASPVRLEVYQDDVRLSNATGLLFESGDAFPPNAYLVTNWHVVAGRHAFSNTPLMEEGSLPNRISAFFTVKSPGRNHGEGDVYFSDERLRLDILLYDGDNSSSTDRPKWKEHPMGRVCDIAALDISRAYECLRRKEIDFHWKGDAYSAKGPLQRPVTRRVRTLFGRETSVPLVSSLSYDSELVISGFPRLAVAPSSVFPLLKRGVVASPPGVPLIYEDKELPAFYADVLTRPGFSGSPVFFRYANLNMRQVGDPYEPTLTPTHATQEYLFVGIYSSRMPEDESKEKIYGMCWHHDAIKSVCENEARPGNPAW